MKKACLLCALATGFVTLLVLTWKSESEPTRRDSSDSSFAPASKPERRTPVIPVQRSVTSGGTIAPAISTNTPVSSPALVSFNDWAKSYTAALPEERIAMTSEGIALAEARRLVLKQLIKSDPQRALEHAVPMVVRQQLPGEVVTHLEERVNGRAALRVYQGVGPDNRTPVPTVRMAEFSDGQTYQTYAYGRRTESVRWVADTSLHGIAIDRDFALHEDPFRTLEVGERPDASKPAVAVCPVSGKSSLAEEDRGQVVDEDTHALEAFGEIVYLCNGSHAIIYKEQLIYAEGGTGAPQPFTGILPAAPTPSLGNVRVLVIPMTFADQNDTPSTESALYQLMRDVGDHYALASYGKLTLLTTVTPTIKVPHNEAWYIQKDSSNGGPIDGLGLEHSHARAEARKLGFDDALYDCIVVRLRGGPRTAGGYGGGSSVWIYGDGVDVTAHEIGHSFGLAHANFWDTAGTSAIGAGSNGEYGGHWDVMGGIGLPLGHYNAAGKNQIRWLPNDYVTEATGSGTYRIFAQDQSRLDASQRFALKITKDSLRTYWGELRGLYTGHATRTWADYGLILGWKFPGGGGNNWQLIDTAPGSPFGKDDSPVSLGRTFSDTEAGIHITTIAVNPATPTQPKSVDVVVNMGTFPSNQPPTLALAASAVVVPLNVPVTFTATANDPDGDALAYSWQHFGDSSYRTISPNAPVITRTFTAAGTYVVTCTVSDMKGGDATRNILVTVGNGGGRFTISGRVTLNGAGLPGVIVNANSANGVLTDRDGRYTIPNLTAATYSMTPLLYGYAFADLFNNSVAVGPNFEGADFEASAQPLVSIAATVPVVRETNAAAPAQFTLTRTGDTAQPLTVSVLGPRGSATVTTDYSYAPVVGSGSQSFSNLTFSADSNTLVVTVTPVNDASVEGPETVTFELGPGNGYLISGLALATVTIDDDDTTLPKISLAVVEAKMVEGSAAPASITFTRTGATTGALAVAYSVSGTASSNDFAALSGTLTIPVGASVATLNISNVNDTVSEPIETVAIRISSAAAFLADPLANSATVSIVDDDAQIVTVIASDAIATERDLSLPGTAADTATFLVTRSGDLSAPLTVYYAMAGAPTGTVATALHGVDYELMPGVLTIPAGQSNASVTVIPRWDGLGEGPESVTLQLGAGPTDYRLGSPNLANITINDAGDPPYVEVIQTDNAVEGGTVGRFRFSLKGSASSNIVVNYTLSGTAAAGADYTAPPGSVSIPGNGVNTVEVSITAINDVLAEELETLTLTITPSPSYTLFAPSSSATIFFFDNEQVTLFVDANTSSYPPTFAETSAGGTFYVSRYGSTNLAIPVNYTVSGSAVNGTDYTALSGTATIPAGALGVDIQVTPVNDVVAEGTETVTLSLAPGAYARGPAATWYISDDESAAVVAGFPTTSATGLENAGTVNIPVTLSAASASQITVEYLVDTGSRASSTATGTGSSPLPYWVRCDRVGNLISGSISLDGTNWTGVSTQTVALPNTSYLAGLYVCSFNVSLLSTTVFDNVIITNLQPGGTVGARTGANIGSTALAGSATVAGSTYTVAGAGDNVEGTTDQGYFTYWPISNSTNCTIIARVVSQQNTANGATAGVMIRESTASNIRRGYMAATPGVGFEYHYRATSGVAEAKVTTIPAKPLWVRLQRAGGVMSAFQSADGAVWTQVGTNLDLVFGPEVLAGLGVSAQVEGQLTTATIDNVTLTPGPLPLLLGRTVGFTATQGEDELAGGVYTITASADGFNGTSDDGHFVSAPVTGDFTLSARITSLTGNATSPQAGVLVRENTGRRARSAFLGGVPGAAPQLIWRNSTLTLANGMGIDYTLAPGLLTFAPGSTTQNIPLAINNDTAPESDEAVMIVLRNATGARLGGSQFAYVVVDDDAPPAVPYVGFAATNSSALEASGTALVPVSLSVPATAAATVEYALTSGSALGGDDFIVATGFLIFNPGDSVRHIAVTLLDDVLMETSETILISLSNPVGLSFSTVTNHTLTILDDDSPVVTISSTDTNATETGDTALVTLTRAGPTNAALTVNLTRAGSAAAGTDYTGINASALIPAGVTTLTLTLTPTQDVTAEGTETAVIIVAPGAGYSVGAPSSVACFIADDDRNIVTIEATGATALEGGTNGTFTVTRSGATTAALTVNLTTTGTATSGSDFTTSPTPITTLLLAAGQASRTISVIPINDTLTEGDEAVLVQIASGSYDIGGLGYDSVTILDNDIPPTVFISSPGAQGVVIASSNGVEFAATAADDGLPQPLAYAWSQVAGPGMVNFTTTNTATAAATFSAPGVYLVRVTVNDGQFSASDQIAVNVGATNSLVPADWISADVGPPTARGFAGRSGSTWVLSAAGGGYTSNSDRAHAVSRQITGDGSIVARVVSVTGTNTAEAGLSLGDSLHRYARRAALVYTPSTKILRFRPRLVANTTDFSINLTNLNLPLWLRLDRSAASNTVAAYYATNNGGEPGPWMQLGTNVNIAMDATADYAIVANSGSDTVLVTAQMDQLALTPAPTNTAQLSEDFGAGTQAGSYNYDATNDLHTLVGKGSLDGSGMFWGQQISGDFILTVLQTNATSAATDARSGLMVRDSMDDGPMAFVGRIPTGSYASFVWRTNPKGGTSGLNGITQRTRWLRMIRRGNQITVLHAPNNAGNTPGAWAQLGQAQTVFLQPTVLVGLYCDNANGGVSFNTATFTKFSIVPLNKAPIVNAGPAPTNSTSPVSITGTVSDDGLPLDFTSEWSVASAPGPVTFANSNALATTASFAASGQFSFRLFADDGLARSFSDVSFTGGANSAFAAWQAANFVGGSANPNAAPDQDPDLDGQNNAAEYATGTNPNIANASPVVVDLETIGPDRFLRVTIPKNPSATDATLAVDASTLLVPATWSAAGLVTETNTATLLRVRDGVPVDSSPNRFMRLRVGITPP
jgi:regulation of enolase protein 1 (concanavalin A-like superfamily)